jgi:hypothetical protein
MEEHKEEHKKEEQPARYPHYISGWGEHGCLYDHCAVNHTYEDAVEYIADMFELGRTRKAELRRSAYLELGRGADYAEITACHCNEPWQHDEDMTEDDWNN